MVGTVSGSAPAITAAASANDTADDKGEDEDARSRTADVGRSRGRTCVLGCALYLGYLMMYIKRTSFDTCTPAILADHTVHVGTEELARLLSHGSLAYGLAKAVAGTVRALKGPYKAH